jgi:chromosome partitioning protein
MIVIAVVNSKGGTGKTTLSAALAVRAAKDSRRVALADLDPQRSLVQWWERRGATENPTVFEGVDEAADAVERVALAGYDWLFLDCPPAFLQTIEEAIHSADFAIIPIKPSLVDLTATQDTIAIARDAETPFLVVINDAVKSDEKLLDGARAFLRKFSVPAADTTMFHRTSHIRGMTVGKSAAEVTGGATAAKDIEELWKEVKAAATKAARARAKRNEAANV